jgi:hypothetical protein
MLKILTVFVTFLALTPAWAISIIGPGADTTAKLSGATKTTSDRGTAVYGVRNDTDANLTASDSQFTPIAVDATGRVKVDATVNEGATGASGAPAPALLKVVAGVDGSGNIQALSTDTSGRIQSDTKVAGKTPQNLARIDYTGTPVTTGAYVQLLAATSAAISEVEIFDSSGQTLVLATGAVASEVDQVYILPGGNGRIPLTLAAGTRVSIKAVSATANAGEISVNFYGL